MGGGTGTGASHVIARVAREMNILTVGVTLYHLHMGAKKNERATAGLNKKTFGYNNSCSKSKLLKLQMVNRIRRSFSLSNNVLKHGVQSITDLMVRPGMINLDLQMLKL